MQKARMRWFDLVVLVGWLAAAAVVIGFFLPWAVVDPKTLNLSGSLERATQGTPLEGLVNQVSGKVGRVVVQVKRGADTVTGELPDLSKIPRTVSGFDIPRLANRRGNQSAVVLAELLSGQQELGFKSYAVYVVPLLALIGAVLVSRGGPPWVSAGVGAVSLLAAGVGGWKLVTTSTDALVIAIRIGPGLWLSVWAYAVLGVAALGRAKQQAVSSR